MHTLIWDKWSHGLQLEGYYEHHFIHRQPELAYQLIQALTKDSRKLFGLIEEVKAYVQSSPISASEVLDSLFKLRDTAVQLDGELTGFNAHSFLKNIQAFILQLNQGLQGSGTSENDVGTVQLPEAVSDGHFYVELDGNFCIRGTDPALWERFQYSKGELTGAPLAVLFSESSQSLLRFAQDQLQNRKRLSIEFEIEAIDKFGQPLQTILKINAEPNEDASGYHAEIRDLTYRAETESLLNLMLMALDNVGDGIVISEPSQEGRILFVNRSLERITGHNRHTLFGKGIKFLQGRFYNKERSEQIFKNLLSSGWEGELNLEQADGGRCPVYMHIRPVRDNQQRVAALVSSIRDIRSEKQRKEQIRWQNKRLQFLQNLAGILNSTLNIKKTLLAFTKEINQNLPVLTLDVFLPVDTQKKYARLIFSAENLNIDYPENLILNLDDCPLYKKLIKRSDNAYYRLPSDLFPSHPYFERIKNLSLGELFWFPLKFTGEIIGLIAIGMKVTPNTVLNNLKFWEQIIDHLTVAVKNAIQFDQLEKQNQKLNLVNTLFHYLNRQATTESLLHNALRDFSHTFGYTGMAIYHVKENQQWTCLSKYCDSTEKTPPFPDAFTGSEYPADVPRFWLDVFPGKPFDKLWKKHFSPQIPKTILWLQTNTVFHHRLVLIGFCNHHYLTDLSYGYHVKLMQAGLEKLAMALDHQLLFQRTVNAEKEWEATFNEVHIGVAVVDAQFNMNRANNAFWSLMGTTVPPESLTTHFSEVMAKYIKEIQESREKNQSGTSRFENMEWRERRHHKHLHIRFSTFYTGDDEFTGGVFTVHDITAEYQKEQHIRYLSKFPEFNPNINLSLSESGEIVYYNEACMKLLKSAGYTEEDINKLVPVTLIFELQNGQFKVNQAHEYIHNFNERIFQYIAYLPEEEENIFLSAIDITDRLELQNKLIQTERMRAMGEMAAGVAHDFNNLLTTIIGRTQLIRLKSNDAQLESELAVVEKAAKDGAKIVKRMQELTREKRQQQFENVYFSEIIQDSLLYSAQKLKLETQVKGQKIQIHTEFEEDIVVFGNPIELKEVFTNLIFNAFDAMPEGGELFLQTRKQGEDTVVAIVRDTGTGIPPKIKQKIFDPFFTTKGERGTGLGLSLVYKIITTHNGTIKVNSETGQGTEFIITLPISATKPKTEIHEERTPYTRLNDIRLLVVDDEPELLETIAEVLKLKFKKVDMAQSGKEALEKIGGEEYDVVLTDLGMPEMSGWEVAREVKKRAPHCHVILVTGWGMQAEEEWQNHHYVDSIISKPYDLHNLLTMIEQLASHNQKAEQV